MDGRDFGPDQRSSTRIRGGVDDRCERVGWEDLRVRGHAGRIWDDSEEVERRVSGRRMDVGSGESGMVKRDGRHINLQGRVC